MVYHENPESPVVNFRLLQNPESPVVLYSLLQMLADLQVHLRSFAIGCLKFIQTSGRIEGSTVLSGLLKLMRNQNEGNAEDSSESV